MKTKNPNFSKIQSGWSDGPSPFLLPGAPGAFDQFGAQIENWSSKYSENFIHLQTVSWYILMVLLCNFFVFYEHAWTCQALARLKRRSHPWKPHFRMPFGCSQEHLAIWGERAAPCRPNGHSFACLRLPLLRNWFEEVQIQVEHLADTNMD